jgi:hydroxyethylthiazole kinase-like uncharacterized protein yjeF
MRRVPLLLTARQAKALDIRAVADYGISTLLLMENAGRQVADETMRLYRGHKKIAVFCGKGNNGGDGIVAARHLLAQGLKPDLYLAARISEVSKAAAANLNIWLKLKQRVVEVSDRPLPRIAMDRYDLIIDALLGVGLTGLVRGIYADLIDRINAARARVISVDIPSGLDATTGRILGRCVQADRTVTFVAKKRGMTIGSGPRACGAITVADLGCPF